MGHRPVNGIALPTLFGIAFLAPVTFGTLRVIELTGLNDWALKFAADHSDNLPLLLHIIGGVVFLVLGAFQILPGTRFRFPRWHRKAGRYVAAFGLLGALSGLWLTLAHSGLSGPILYWGRILSSSAWAGFILISLWHIRTRSFQRHGRWMIRAFALGLPAGTLALFLFPLVLIYGEDENELLFEIVQVLAWPFHLAVAEWLMRRTDRRKSKAMRGAVA